MSAPSVTAGDEGPTFSGHVRKGGHRVRATHASLTVQPAARMSPDMCNRMHERYSRRAAAPASRPVPSTAGPISDCCTTPTSESATIASRTIARRIA